MSWTAWEAAQTPATFRVIFPEFTGASDALVESRIAMAAERTDAEVWGTLVYQGIAYLAAELLSLLPGAKDLRLEGGAESVYGRERKRLEGIVSSGFRIAGLP